MNTLLNSTRPADQAVSPGPAQTNGHAGTATESAAPAITVVYQSHRTGEHTTTKPRRAVGPQMSKDSENLAVKRAEGAAIVKKALGLTLAEAVKGGKTKPC